MNSGLDPRKQATLSFYWSARFSCCIQKFIADSYLNKTKIINGNLTRNHQFIEGSINNIRLPTG